MVARQLGRYLAVPLGCCAAGLAIVAGWAGLQAADALEEVLYRIQLLDEPG